MMSIVLDEFKRALTVALGYRLSLIWILRLLARISLVGVTPTVIFVHFMDNSSTIPTSCVTWARSISIGIRDRPIRAMLSTRTMVWHIA